MKRRAQDGVSPPAELVSYTAWCAAAGVEPYGHDGAVMQWAVWLSERDGWEARHGEGLEMGAGCDAPFDASVI